MHSFPAKQGGLLARRQEAGVEDGPCGYQTAPLGYTSEFDLGVKFVAVFAYHATPVPWYCSCWHG